MVTSGRRRGRAGLPGPDGGPGLPLENIWVTDIEGVRRPHHPGWTLTRRASRKTDARKLAEVIEGADVFLGLSAGGVLKPEMVAKMACVR